ncbi:MAG: hypothetical protein ABR530_09160 [Pyrinomonadaceae bacterium]
MKKLVLLLAFVALSAVHTLSQSPFSLKRMTTKTETFSFGSGGTVSIIGAPRGSITVDGGPGNEIEVTAEIEIEAATDADLSALSEVVGFVLDGGRTKSSIITIGPHNKFGGRKLPKKFPKHLMGLPFRINYVIKVPLYTDLQIDGGVGELKIKSVQGSSRINFLDATGTVEVGGSMTATFGAGSVDVVFGVNGWRGRTANIQMATGNLSIAFPAKMSADVDARVLRTGKVENLVPALKPRGPKAAFTDQAVLATAGAGGVPLIFSVGDGTLKLTRLDPRL